MGFCGDMSACNIWRDFHNQAAWRNIAYNACLDFLGKLEMSVLNDSFRNGIIGALSFFIAIILIIGVFLLLWFFFLRNFDLENFIISAIDKVF